jgi:hypothetical protein
MKKSALLILLSLLCSSSFGADKKISELTLGTASAIVTNDSFPYVDSVASTTKRLKIAELFSVPALSTALALKANLASPTFSGVVKSPAFTTTESNPASGFFINLANNGGGIAWRNALNDGNLSLNVDTSNRLTYNGGALFSSGGILVSTAFPALTGDISTSAGSLTTAIGSGKVTNAMLAGSIAYSKLALTGAILNADLAGSIAYSKLSLTGAILNADLAGSIAYSKLNLTGAILNADLAGSIAYSKLNLTGAILNADLAGSIAYSKLSLTGAILNADLAGSIADTKLSTIATAGKVSDSALPSSMATKTFTGVTNYPGSSSIDGSGNATFVAGTYSGALTTSATTQNTALGNGSLRTSGGASVQKNMSVGGTLFLGEAAVTTGQAIVDVAQNITTVSILGSAYQFTVTAANATAGATYTNNGQTFTVYATIAGATTLFCNGTGAPGASGTLTKTSGTGDSTITFSASATTTTQGATADFPAGSSSPQGLLFVTNNSSGKSALFLVSITGITVITGSDTVYSTTQGTASKDNVYLNSTNLRIEHNSATTAKSFSMLWIRMGA